MQNNAHICLIFWKGCLLVDPRSRINLSQWSDKGFSLFQSDYLMLSVWQFVAKIWPRSWSAAKETESGRPRGTCSRCSNSRWEFDDSCWRRKLSDQPQLRLGATESPQRGLPFICAWHSLVVKCVWLSIERFMVQISAKNLLWDYVSSCNSLSIMSTCLLEG